VKSQRKRLVGTVVSAKMDKTAVVEVERTARHPLYEKVMRLRKKYKVHDEENTCRVGDTVQIVESRPLSRQKHWRVDEILERSKIAEVGR
jgi:small subunit ribosomal protein S17